MNPPSKDHLVISSKFLLMPMIIRNLHNNRDQHDKRDWSVMFQDGQEEIVLEKTHRTISNLKVGSRDAFYQTFE